jgi:hypothetical protein
MAEAYEKTGNSKDAAALRERLAHLNEPTIEQAIVVPEVRAALEQ